MNVSVMGAGHVGLVTCVTLAHLGHQVSGLDSDEEKVSRLRDGTPWFYEPGVDELMAEGMEQGRLSFTSRQAEGLPGAEVIFICVGTPPRASGEASLVAVERAAREVARHATGRVVIAEKSTVPAGTAERIKWTLAHEAPDRREDLEVVSNPEFLREGMAVRDALQPDRILVGAGSSWAFERMRRLYEPLVRQGIRLIETDIATAELSKHASNAFLALKISYANALARLCERAGADVTAVADIMGADSRIGRAFLDAGLGYGGFCFPKDLQAFERLAFSLGYDFTLLREIAHINEEALQAALDKIERALWNLEEKRIALLGLSFKPQTDDVRFSPALELARRLLDEGADVVGYDPAAMPQAKQELPQPQGCDKEPPSGGLPPPITTVASLNAGVIVSLLVWMLSRGRASQKVVLEFHNRPAAGRAVLTSANGAPPPRLGRLYELVLFAPRKSRLLAGDSSPDVRWLPPASPRPVAQGPWPGSGPSLSPTAVVSSA